MKNLEDDDTVGQIDIAEAERLRNEEGWSYRQIGDRFGVSHQAVWKALRKAGKLRYVYGDVGLAWVEPPAGLPLNPKATKLTPADVENIRRSYATGLFTQTQLAGRFGISQKMVSWIVRGERWRST